MYKGVEGESQRNVRENKPFFRQSYVFVWLVSVGRGEKIGKKGPTDKGLTHQARRRTSSKRAEVHQVPRT